MSDWPLVRIRDLCESIIDCVNKTAPVVDGPSPYRMIRTTNVKGGRVDLTTTKYVDQATYERWVRRGKPQAGDIILTREAPLGEVGMLRDAAGVFLGQRLVMYRVNDAVADRNFLLASMRGGAVQSQIKSLGSGSTVEHMRVPDCGELLIACPPIKDQRRIGAVFAALDDLIAVNERRIELIEDLARSLYREWFVRFRFPGRGETPANGELPDGWSRARLGDVVTLNYGKALPAQQRHPGPVAVVSSAGIIDEHDEPLVEAPGIVLGRKGNVGSVCWVDRPFFPIDTTYYVETDIPLALLYWQLRDMTFIDSHAAVPGLSRDNAYAQPLDMPPVDLANRFADIHATYFESIAALRTQNAATATIRDLLLPRLVTGRLDISEVDLGALLPVEAA